MAYIITMSHEARDHLNEFRKGEQQTIDVQLQHEPGKVTRNRKQLIDHPIAPWELRVQSFHVFYDIIQGEPPQVWIVAVGRKVREQVSIGGKVISYETHRD
jgi:hypothetical protein